MIDNQTEIDRRFQIWEFSVSHGRLLIRSPAGPESAKNIDLLFSGVQYMACARLMRGIRIEQPSTEDNEVVTRLFRALRDSEELHVLVSAEGRNYIVAASAQLSENGKGLFDGLDPI